MKAQLTASTLKARIPRRSPGWFVVIAAAVVTAGLASALLLTRSGATNVPVPIQAPATVAPAIPIPAIGPANTGSVGDHGVATPPRLDDRRFGEPIGLAPQSRAPSVRSGYGSGGSVGSSREGGCTVRQPRC